MSADPKVFVFAQQVCCNGAGSDLTTFSKTGERPDPKIIAHRSAATRGEMLVCTPPGFAQVLAHLHAWYCRTAGGVCHWVGGNCRKLPHRERALQRRVSAE